MGDMNDRLAEGKDESIRQPLRAGIMVGRSRGLRTLCVLAHGYSGKVALRAKCKLLRQLVEAHRVIFLTHLYLRWWAMTQGTFPTSSRQVQP